jgi:casein kinase II subunit beta
MSDKLRAGRVKVFCPRCEEVYIPINKFNLDGATFGPALPHMFLKFYSSQLTIPPKTLLYEPRIFGFKIATKRGSKYFNPCSNSEQS